MKWAAHFWTTLKARLGGLVGFKSKTSPTEAPIQGHQANYTPHAPIPQVSVTDRGTIWTRWEKVAPPRMDRFKDAVDTCPLDPASKYIWANHLAGAITPALHTFEIAFRNSMHSSLRAYYGQEDWFDAPGFFQVDEEKLLKAAKRGAKKKAKAQGRQHTPDDVVAELMLGFWCALLNSPYDTSVFRPCLSRAFANLPAPLRVRTDLHNKVLEFKRVRNRVFHHEPIWNYPGIDQIEAELWVLAEALYPEFAILSQDQASFQPIYNAKVVLYKQSLDTCLANCIAQGRIQP